MSRFPPEVSRTGQDYSKELRSAVRVLTGPFTVDVDGRQLLRDGKPVHVTPKAYHLLTLLLDAAPRALSKDELQQSLWPSTFVDEANLSVLVAELRSALSDDARRPSYIRTVHGFGYAFCGPVARDSGEVQAGPPSGWLLVSEEEQLRLARGVTRVGRDPACEIVLDSASVSRRHARVVVDDGAPRVEDLGSKNGTWVNGRRIDSPAVLDDGDEVRFGSVRWLVRRAWEAASTETIGPL